MSDKPEPPSKGMRRKEFLTLAMGVGVGGLAAGVTGLAHAGSRWAFHTIGSLISVTCPAYAAVRGFPRRQAGEDFYFLQELAKTGGVSRIDSTTVHPSARSSDRVPFGTGATVGRHLSGTEDGLAVYHPDVYKITSDFVPLRKIDETSFSALVNWDVGFANLRAAQGGRASRPKARLPA